MSEPGGALRVWLQRLQSPEPVERETSIKELEMLGATDALAALADVFATDPDPSLRVLAQWAGKSIYYGAIQRELDAHGPSEEERQRAAAILEQARAKKSQTRRKR